MPDHHEVTPSPEAQTERERILAEQNEAMRNELIRLALENHGFETNQIAFTRRQIYEDLQSPHPRFNPGYRPTRAEILSRVCGRENWIALPTGGSLDQPDPWRDETPDITEMQNLQYHLYVRDKDRDDGQSAFDIEQSIRDKFPPVDSDIPETQPA